MSVYYWIIIVRQLHCIGLHTLPGKVKVSSPITGLDRPCGFQEVEAPRFQDNRYMKVVRLSALLPGNIPGTHFC